MKKENKIKFTIVNLITLSRVIGSILLPIYYFTMGIKYMGILVAILFLTDMIDGRLSRKWKVESFLGALLDSVSDKLFAFVMLAILTYEYPIMLLVILLEFIIFGINTLAFKENKNIYSSKMGKFKTLILDLNVSILYLIKARNYFNKIIPVNILNFLNKNDYSISLVLAGVIVGTQLLTISNYSKSRMKQTTYEKIDKKELKSFKEIWELLIDREFYIKNKNENLRKLLYKSI